MDANVKQYDRYKETKKKEKGKLRRSIAYALFKINGFIWTIFRIWIPEVMSFKLRPANIPRRSSAPNHPQKISKWTMARVSNIRDRECLLCPANAQVRDKKLKILLQQSLDPKMVRCFDPQGAEYQGAIKKGYSSLNNCSRMPMGDVKIG